MGEPDNIDLCVSICPVQGIEVDNFEEYIEQNKPVTFTDPKVPVMLSTLNNNSVNFVKADPYICGHRAHSTNSCGIRFSTGAKTGLYGGPGDGPGLWFA